MKKRIKPIPQNKGMHIPNGLRNVQIIENGKKRKLNSTELKVIATILSFSLRLERREERPGTAESRLK